MRSISPSAAIAVAMAASALAAPAPQSNGGLTDIITSYAQGLKNATIRTSEGGHALCIGGYLEISASANNFAINFPEPANKSALTDLLVRSSQYNSTVAEEVISGKSVVTGTWNIYSQLCFPLADGAINTTTVQFLIHGLGADYNYWDNAPGYSYVDYAAQQGYTTFIYDRLGAGRSDHPDPIATVQGPMSLEIAHQLIQLLRNGGIAGQTFRHVIGVGHSFGSFTTNAVAVKYPADFDAIVLTGYSTSDGGTLLAFIGGGLTIAADAVPSRFGDLAPGYTTGANMQGLQFSFFREPAFDPDLLALCEQTKGTISVGEFLTTSTLQGVATNFTGPLYVVDGEHDLPNCYANCYEPQNWAASLKPSLFPNAKNSSDWYIQPGAGHFINYHYGAETSWQNVQAFIKKHGF